jgi:hypothetical protein
MIPVVLEGAAVPWDCNPLIDPKSGEGKSYLEETDDSQLEDPVFSERGFSPIISKLAWATFRIISFFDFDIDCNGITMAEKRWQHDDVDDRKQYVKDDHSMNGRNTDGRTDKVSHGQ